MYDLWEAFNDIAEGFGLTIEEFQEILKSALMEHLSLTEKLLNIDADQVFRTFDDDENNLVDSLEFLSSFALLSGMTPDEKIRFIFAMYDFDEVQLLTLDEMVLAFRSTLSGLSKLSKINPPTESEVEIIVVQGFDAVRKASGAIDIDMDYPGMDRESFINFCLNTPEIMSWIEYFDDIEEYESELANQRPVPRPEPSHMDRTPLMESVMNPTLGGLKRREWERKGLAKDILPRLNYQNILQYIAPLRIPDQPRDVPPHNVKLEWAYGYNAHSSKQNAFYSAKGALIFPAGAVCVILDNNERKQRHFVGHADLVTCLKLYHTEKGDTIVASGDCGVRPAIHVWDCETQQLLSTIKGFHRNGITQVDFSPDRTKLVSIGMDTYHSIAVHAWATRELLYSARTTFDKVMDVRFLSDDLLASCGKDHVYFWKATQPRGYRRFRGLFGTAVRPESLLCVHVVGATIVTGSETGMLHVWEGRNIISSIKAHPGSITCMYVVDQGKDKGLITACSTGKIQIWTQKLEVGLLFNGYSLGAVEPSIASVCWNVLASKIIIGFKTCEIFEIDAVDGRNVHNSAVVSSHYSPKVSGLCTHPQNPKMFCTVGNDKTVRIFDAELHKQLRVSLLDTIGHCCCFSPDGQKILVGMGNGIDGCEERKEGAYVVLNEEDLTLVHEARDSKSMITDCKFSPQGDTMAISSLDGSIYVYNAVDFAARSRCRGHVGKVVNVDYSHDGQFMMTNSLNGELLFWDVEKGDVQLPKTVKEVQWETNSCIYSYATQGTWGPYDDGVVNSAVCRSHSRDLIATVDNFGRLRVFVCPVYKEQPNFILRYGHSADVQNVKFSCDDSYIFTSGGTDGCILQWKVLLPETQDYEDMKRDEVVLKEVPFELAFEGKPLERLDNCENVVNDKPTAICAMEEGIDDITSLLPWQRTIVAPSRVPQEDHSEPPDVLELEFVYGYAADRSREAINYTIKGEVVFFIGSVVVIMNQTKRTQKFYTEHSSTVTAMAVHKDQPLIATGDLGELPCIRVWNSETFETVSIMAGFHRRAINHLKFSNNGNLLVSVGQDMFHSVAVYNWQSQQIVSTAPGTQQKSFYIDFLPNGSGLIQCGNEVIRFWEMDGLNMSFQDALLGSRAKLQGYMCVGWIGIVPIVGTADGYLYRFAGRQLDAMVQAHTKCVNAISSTNDGICSAGSDGFVKIWTRTMECRLVIDLRSLKVVTNVARCVAWDANYARIIIGTESAEIFEVSAGDGENMHGGPLLEGHSGHELWGLAVNPTKEEYCTVGDDALLCVWDIFEHITKVKMPLEMPARCCAFSPDGKQLAVGFGCPHKVSPRQYDGKWVILDTEDYQVSHEARDSTKWLTDIKFSPNGELLGVGSYDNKLYVYNVPNGFALVAVIAQHQSFIKSLDFSEDNTWLQSNCGGFELCFFEADTGMYIPAASRLRDQAWATQSCTLGWAVQGIWPPQRDGTEITACECNLFRGTDGAVVVSGDNYGRLQVYRYPCTSSFSSSKKYRLSSNPITRIRFVAGDSKLISLAGVDKCIMQWAHKRDRSLDIAWNVNERAGNLEEEDDDVMMFMGMLGATEEKEQDLNALVTSKPWVAAIVAPTNPRSSIDTPPDYRLERSHVYGLQSSSTRGSVHFNFDGDVLFPSSHYVCVYNKKSNAQLFYEGHVKEISAVAVSRDGVIAASAERANRPSIHIWDAKTCQSIIVLSLFHRKAVSFMQFSADRKMMVSVGQDQDHSLALWQSPNGDWADGTLLAASKGDVHPVLYCSFFDSTPDGYAIATGGRFHQKFWTVNGKCLNANYASYDPKQKIGTVLCGTSVGHKFICGTTTGHLFVWLGRKLDRMVRAHEKGVSAIWSCGKGVITGSKCGMVKLWTVELEHIRSFTLADADVPPVLSTVRSLDGALSIDGSSITRILVATAGGEIYEISARSGNICLLHESHYTGELWGLCTHPLDPDVFATVGDDKTIRVWSLSHKRLLRKAVLDCTARSIGWSKDGRNLVVGMGGSGDGKRQRKDGAFLLLDAENLRPLFEGRDSRHWIQDVKFTPDGRSFAVASMDHKIYIYSRETLRLKGTCDRHNSFIRGFDFSEDSVYVQSDSGDYEHLYFEAEDGEYFPAGSQLKDIRWGDWTCCFGWPVQGVWPYFDAIEKGLAFDPTTVHRSPDESLLAVGDLGGNVKLYNYPCLNKSAVPVEMAAHVKEVSKVRFTCDGKHVISLGKYDRSIVSWKVLPEKAKRR